MFPTYSDDDSKMPSMERDSGQISARLRQLWPLLLTGLLIVVAAFGGDLARLELRYDKAAVTSGQYWRLISGHFVHLGWQHMLLNLAGLSLVILLFSREYRAGQWLILIAVCIAAISAGFVVFRPDLVWYVGLSGVLHGLFLAGAIRWISRGEPEGYVLAIFLAGKLVFEQVNGALPLSVASAGGAVIVDAHLYGAVAGSVVGLWFIRDGRSRHR